MNFDHILIVLISHMLISNVLQSSNQGDASKLKPGDLKKDAKER